MPLIYMYAQNIFINSFNNHILSNLYARSYDRYWNTKIKNIIHYSGSLV